VGMPWKGGPKESSKRSRIKHRDKAKERLIKWRAENREKDQETRKRYKDKHPLQARESHLRRVYGLTLGAFDSMLSGQGGVCAICGGNHWGGKWNTPMVDHDHDTGEVRGILCSNCNMAISKLKDSPDILRVAANYLEGNKGK
jgi:hypothetical protein